MSARLMRYIMLQRNLCEHSCKANFEVRLIYRDGHCKQRLAARTVEREGRFACLDRLRELGAVRLADGNDWNPDW